MRSRAAARLLLAMTAMCAACDFDLVEVETVARAAPARLIVELAVTELAGAAELAVSVHPGRASNGELRALVSDSIRINGIAAAPAESFTDGGQFYRLEGLNPSLPVHVRAPTISGLGDIVPDVTVQPIRVVAPDTLTVLRSGFVELRIEGMDAGDSVANAFWSVEVRADSGRAAMFLTSSTPPQPLLRFPAEILPAGITHATLRITGTASYEVLRDPDLFRLGVRRSFGAVVHLVIVGG